MRVLGGAAALVGGTLAGTWVVTVLAGAPAARLVETLRHGDLLALPLESAVSGGCALALLCAWAWAVARAATTALHVLRCRGHQPDALPPPGRGPARLVTLVVAAALGTGAAAPASASPPTGGEATGRPTVAGLRVPDRVATVAPDRTQAPVAATAGTVTVAPGDSVWSVAERLAGPGADLRTVHRTWLRVLAHNPSLVDPDLVHPGTRLRVPDLTPAQEELP